MAVLSLYIRHIEVTATHARSSELQQPQPTNCSSQSPTCGPFCGNIIVYLWRFSRLELWSEART